MEQGPTRIRLLAAVACVACLGLAAGGHALGSEGDPATAAKKTKKKKGGAVKLEVGTDSQEALLAAGAIEAEVRGKAKVTLSARQGLADGLVTPTTVKSRSKPTTVQLPLTEKGRTLLGACGQQSFSVLGTYSKRKGKKRKRRTATADGTLRAASAPCALHVDAPNADRCDPIDPAHCLLPYPNDYFTRSDSSTDTGLRVNLHPASMPVNVNGVSAFHAELNRNDGFSPNNVIMARVPGIETPAAFRANDLVPQMDIGSYEDPSQRVVLIDAATGDRVPIWAELDMVPGTPNPHNGNVVQGTANDRSLLIHPAVALEYGKRYIVALRGLTDANGVTLQPNTVFRAYRDGVTTDNAAVEARRPKMEDVFSKLGTAGIGRADLYLAWDFTVASERNLTERLLAMRDDAFAQLNDTDLDDGDVDGNAPTITITGETPYLLCNSDGDADNCELDSATPESDYAFKRVTGTVRVPCYMNAPGAAYAFVDANVPCASGSRLHYEPGEDLPSQNGSATWEAPFTCTLPREGDADGDPAGPQPGVIFGHGLLGDHRTVEHLTRFPASLQGVACGTNWIGLSGADSVTGDLLQDGDVVNHLFKMIQPPPLGSQDLSLFSALPDRSQQGYVNTLYLARAMAHPQGLCAEPEFDVAGVCALSIDENDTADDLGYFGVSLGGIFGGATTSVAPDWERAALSVPGMGFTTLLSRSTQFNTFLPAIYTAYPDPLGRQIGMSVLQLLWDRGEPSSYVHRMTDEPFDNTPAHQVMIHEAFGDHQVANVQTETLGRSLDAAVRTPVIDPVRLDDRPDTDPGTAGVQPFLFSDTIDPFTTPDQLLAPSADFQDGDGLDGQSAVIYTFDTGAIPGAQPFNGSNANPDWNIAPLGRSGMNPNDGLDPHEPGATSPKAQQIAIPFLLDQGMFDACLAPGPGVPAALDMPPWNVPYTGTAQPCTAPPVHSPGQGQ
jgi:hypothetical protein